MSPTTPTVSSSPGSRRPQSRLRSPLRLQPRRRRSLRSAALRPGRLVPLALAGLATVLAATTQAGTGLAYASAVSYNPVGQFEYLSRVPNSNDVLLTGWALDANTSKPITVAVTVDKVAAPSVVAGAARADVGRRYPSLGRDHGINARVRVSAGEHHICLIAKNVGGGRDTSLGCRLVIAVHPVPTSAPRSVHATSSYWTARIAWTAPAVDGGAPAWEYLVTASPGGRTIQVSGLMATTSFGGLDPATTYSFSVRAVNMGGTSAAARSNSVRTSSGPPPQRTPAPVATSRYIRNVRGASAAEQARMRAEGAADARANPAGHAYLVLLDIGGQDQYGGGVVLTTGVRFVSYVNLVRDVAAYLDGYRSAQHPGAPVLVAAGTNNDMDVNGTTGANWATRVVNPLVAHVAGWSGIRVAGANDIEPGFRASYTQTRAWLSGYLHATTAPFVFNGSADGCAWTATNRSCNNGWSMSGLYSLAAGAAPTRVLNLPQIYNTTMAKQWKYISLTGISRHAPRINFGGPLTERTACAQARSCGSLSGYSAWLALWNQLQSDHRLRVGSLPYATDLRIDSVTRRTAGLTLLGAVAVMAVCVAGCTSTTDPRAAAAVGSSAPGTTSAPVASTSAASSAPAAGHPSSAAASGAAATTAHRAVAGPRTTASVAPVPRSTCTTLAIRVVRGSAAPGREFAALQFTNTGSSTCRLVGYPSVTLRRAGSPIGSPAQPASDADSGYVLPAGATAESMLNDYTSCQAPLSDELRVGVPGSTANAVRPAQLRACALRVGALGPPS